MSEKDGKEEAVLKRLAGQVQMISKCEACVKAEEMESAMGGGTFDDCSYYPTVDYSAIHGRDDTCVNEGNLALMAEHLKEFHCTCDNKKTKKGDGCDEIKNK